MKRRLHRTGQRFEEVKERRRPCKGQHTDINDPIVIEPFAAQRQHDQRDGGRIDQHEHGQRVADDRGKADVGDAERNYGKQDGPRPIGEPVGKHPREGLRAARDQTDRGFEAGERDRHGKNEASGAPEIMPRDLCEGNAAVFRGLKQTARLHAHPDRQYVNDGHQDAGQDARLHDLLCDCAVLGNAHLADHVNDDDAEGQPSDGVHRAVALYQRRKQRAALIPGVRFDRPDRGSGMKERGRQQNREEQQEHRIDDFSDPEGDIAGTQGENQNKCEKYQREEQKGQPFRRAACEHRRDTGGKRGRGASGNREQRPDGQIQHAGEEIAVPLPCFRGQRLKTVGMGVADGRDTENWNADGGHDKTDHGRDHVPSGQLTEMHREDQIARAEEHTE